MRTIPCKFVAVGLFVTFPFVSCVAEKDTGNANGSENGGSDPEDASAVPDAGQSRGLPTNSQSLSSQRDAAIVGGDVLDAGSEGPELDGSHPARPHVPPDAGSRVEPVLTGKQGDAGRPDAGRQPSAGNGTTDEGKASAGVLLGPPGIEPFLMVGPDDFVLELNSQRSSGHMQFSSAGNLYVAEATGISKYENGLFAWSFDRDLGELGGLSDFVVDDNENLYVVGGGFDQGSYWVRLYRVSADGVLEWETSFASESPTGAKAIALGPDGAVTLVGTSDGIIDGQPAALATGSFAARFEPDGTLSWVRQYDPVAETLRYKFGHWTAFTDSSGITYAITGYAVQMISETGEELQTLIPPDTCEPSVAPCTYGRVASSGDGAALYAWTVAGPGLIGGLLKFTSSYEPIWWRTIEPAHTAVLDVPKYQQYSLEFGPWDWTGAFVGGNEVTDNGRYDISVTKHAVYLTGRYDSVYLSQFTPATFDYGLTTGVIGKYDLDGERVWATALVDENFEPSGVAASVEDPDGNLIVSLAGFPNLFKLSGQDGSLL